MKSAFRGYYPPSKSELDQLWTEGLVILDTNALLNLFRYTEETRVDLLQLLSDKADLLWIPHQVGLEFHRNRIGVINDQDNAFADIENALTSAQKSVQNAIGKLKHHPSLDPAGLSKLLETSIATITEGLATAKQDHLSAVVEKGTNEHTFEKITALYAGKVGEPFPAAKLETLYKEGKTRYDAKTPPGFKDQDKGGIEQYGDLILWKQILEKVATDKKPALFITDDAKEDWWYKVAGKTQGPRPELVDEYYAAAEHRIHFYAPDRFLAFAKERGSTISDESVAEAEKVSTATSVEGRSSLTASEWVLMEEERLALKHRKRGDFPSASITLERVEIPEVVLRAADRVFDFENRLSSIKEDIENYEAAYDSGDLEVMEEASMVLRVLNRQRKRAEELAELARKELRALENRERHRYSGAERHGSARTEALERRIAEPIIFDIEPDSED